MCCLITCYRSFRKVVVWNFKYFLDYEPLVHKVEQKPSFMSRSERFLILQYFFLCGSYLSSTFFLHSSLFFVLKSYISERKTCLNSFMKSPCSQFYPLKLIFDHENDIFKRFILEKNRM